MLTQVLRALGILTLLLTLLPAVAQNVPDGISYQGKLTDSAGKPVPDDTYEVMFKAYDINIGGAAFWTSSVQSAKTAGGLFTTQISSLTPATISGKTDIWLETLVRPTPRDPWDTLAPRVKLNSAPFSLRSGDLTLPFSGTINSASTAFLVANEGSGTAILGRNAGTGKAGYFQIDNSLSSNAALYATHNGTGYAIYGYNSGTGRAGSFQISNLESGADALVTATNGSGSAFWAYNSGSGRAGYFQISNGSSTADAMSAYTNGDGDAVYGLSAGAGNAVYGYNSSTGRAGYFYSYNTANSSPAVEAMARGTGDAGRFLINNAANAASALYGATNGSGAAINGYNNGTGRAAYLQIENPANSRDALYVTTNGTGRAVYASSPNTYSYLASPSYGVFGWSSADSGRGVYGYGTGAGGYGAYGYCSGTDGYGVYAYAPYGTGLYAKGSSSGWAATFAGNVLITDRSTGDAVMELGKGLDYAEGFDVSDEGKAGPGTVLVIDPKNPGKLAVSTTPYDRKVAGIVAGGKDLGSGVRLGAGQFDRDVALAGRVYCNMDATKAGIEPGDLLTTSTIPGYAMKVTDNARAQGAILGKAMEPLAKGTKGQILVLVTLQ